MLDNKPKPHYRCFLCLRSLGYGYDRTAKAFGISKKRVARWFKQHGHQGAFRPKQAKVAPKPKVDWNARWKTKSQKYLRTYLRTKLWYFWKHNMHPSTAKLIGCSRTEFISHIVSQFKPGMNLSNYTVEWEFDHIVPLVNFNLKNESHRLKAFHFSNIRPLHPHLNAVKAAKMVAV